MAVQLQEATAADMSIARNLVAYYIYDMSEYLGWPCKPDGTFGGCDDLETYWREENKHAFLLRSGQEIAGFTLVDGNHKQPAIDFSIGEFFILRKFRRQGVGEYIARQLFDRFPGRWQVEQLAANAPAKSFWRAVIGRYSNGEFVERTRDSEWGKMNVITFDSRVAGKPAGAGDKVVRTDEETLDG